MRVLVNITCFIDEQIQGHDIWHYGQWLNTEFSFKIACELKYEVLKVVTGLHKEATRPHYHMFMLCETNDSKVYKTLNDKIQRIIPLLGYPVPTYKVYSTQKYNVSFLYEGDSKKFKKATIVYDETAIRYPLKENNDNHFYYGMDNEEFQSLQSLARKEWILAKQKQTNLETKKALAKDEKAKLEDFVIEQAKSFDMYSEQPKTRIKFIMTQIIEYSVTHDISFNINQLKNKAINILRKHEWMTTEEIVDLIYIG